MGISKLKKLFKTGEMTESDLVSIAEKSTGHKLIKNRSLIKNQESFMLETYQNNKLYERFIFLDGLMVYYSPNSLEVKKRNLYANSAHTVEVFGEGSTGGAPAQYYTFGIGKISEIFHLPKSEFVNFVTNATGIDISSCRHELKKDIESIQLHVYKTLKDQKPSIIADFNNSDCNITYVSRKDEPVVTDTYNRWLNYDFTDENEMDY